MRSALVTALLLAACSSAPPPAASQPAATAATTPAAAAASAAATPGATPATAIEVCRPEGERAYLRRLRCADGTPPQFERRGSGPMRNDPRTPEEQKDAADQFFGEVPPGGRDYHIVDIYDVRCGDATAEVLLDMYHCAGPPPAVAPAGFTIVP